ncbi:hypothetical protein [Streptomyces sp. ALI-76-A]|nr:hypothetical protein [Streptomyces sp. ALI-76-A]MDL5204973.1 hypothetical protein [Streptomyces sp. ALI-76-A]
MIEALNDIQRYGWPIFGLLTLVFIVGFALEDLFRSWQGKGKRGE